MIHVTDASFDAEVMKSTKPVLVDFFATWCGPCKLLSAVIEKAAPKLEAKAKVVKVDVEMAPDTAAKYGIMSVPSVFVFKNGNVVEKKVGGMSEDALIALVEKHV